MGEFLEDLAKKRELGERESRANLHNQLLTAAIGRQVREYRFKRNLKAAELAAQSGLSAGMLSRIENGQISPSLATLRQLSEALGIPVSALFTSYENVKATSYVLAGEGIVVERHGAGEGHIYRMIGSVHSRGSSAEAYDITVTKRMRPLPVFRHAGIEFIHVIEGGMCYRHGEDVHELRAGDTLMFDAEIEHGPTEFLQLPLHCLSVISSSVGVLEQSLLSSNIDFESK